MAPARRSPPPPRPRSSIPRISAWLAVTAACSLCACLAAFRAHVASQPHYPPGSLPSGARGGGAGSCQMSFMSPSYLHLAGFGREFTRLGNGPWGLYLYREAGWDDDPVIDPDSPRNDRLRLTGTPVLFVPGNAGSFRQVRSLAAAAARTWSEVPGVRRKGVATRDGAASLDFFTLDFNDDFSAFHGQTLLDQAEYTADCIRYILSLYANHEDEATGRDRRPDPTAVIVVGHSMGGIVARAAFLNPHYQSYSISTLITFATPHAVPPVTVDSGVDRVYDAINSYWRDAYELSSTFTSTYASLAPPSPALPAFRAPPHEELRDLVLISISGGLSDVTIASESVSLSSLVPTSGSNGFTVFTTAIPGVQTPIDHLAILWCRQLMYQVASGLLSIVDVRRAEGVLPREERVAELSRRWLGSGVERPALDKAELRDSDPAMSARRVPLEALERGAPLQQLEVGQRLVVQSANAPRGRQAFVMPVPPSRTYTGPRVFSLLTSASIGRRKAEQHVEVWACRHFGAAADPEAGDSAETACAPLFPQHVASMPASPHAPTSPILPAPIEEGRTSLVSLEAEQLEGKDSIVVIVKEGARDDWVLAEFADRDKRVQVVDKGALQLLGGHKVEALPAHPVLVSEIWLPALDTSLLTLKLHVYRSECQEKDSLFAPLLRQYSPVLHETKYFPNVRRAALYTHASGPYLPPPASPFASSGTRLQFFLDPTCAHEPGKPDLALEIKVDVWATLGALVVRYRMAMVTVPFALVMLVFGKQVKEYNTGSAFPPFGATFSTFARRTFPALVLGLLALSYLQTALLNSHSSSHDHLASAEPGHHRHSHLALPPSWIATALLGNAGSFWAPLAPFLVFALLGVVVLEYWALYAIVAGGAWMSRLVQAKGPARLKALFPIAEPAEPLPLQRILTMIGLLFIVLFFAPYQFAFLVIALVHLFSTMRILAQAQETVATSSAPGAASSAISPAAAKRLWDRYHYSFSVLFVLVTLLPINALILVVWVRNLAVGWLAPFSSDHNVLMVFGFLANVEALHSGKMLQRSTGGRFSPLVTAAAFVIPAAYSLLYGIRFAHRLYSLANLGSVWLALGSSDAFVGADPNVLANAAEGASGVPGAGVGSTGKRRTSAPPEPVGDLLTADGVARKVASVSASSARRT
ncbi:Bst1p [Rhodotorula paludigena]|uniref:Bst1p n=1 Tax=Rhodotorula paludigena TaxID=86838 RepID=UPI003170A9B3